MSKKDPKDFSEPPFEVYTDSADETLQFGSYAELSDWARRQVELWEPASRLAGVEGAITQAAWTQTTGFYSNLEAQAGHAANHPDEGTRGRARNTVAANLALLRDGLRVTADSPPGQHILDEAVSNPKAAAARLVWAAGGEWGQAQALTPEFRKWLIAVQIEDQIGHNEPRRHKAKLTRLFNDWTRDFAFMEEQAYKKTETIRRLAQTILRNQQQEKRHHAEEMARIEKTFMERMRLEAPAKYWSDRVAKSHRTAGLALMAFVAVSVVAAISLFWHWDSVMELIAVSKDSTGINLLPAVAFTLPAVLLLWILRLIARIFVTSLATARDSSHRSTLIQTYLALMAEESSGVTEQDRLLILQALFRPESATADDDAPPPHLLEIMAKAAGVTAKK